MTSIDSSVVERQHSSVSSSHSSNQSTKEDTFSRMLSDMNIQWDYYTEKSCSPNVSLTVKLDEITYDKTVAKIEELIQTPNNGEAILKELSVFEEVPTFSNHQYNIMMTIRGSRAIEWYQIKCYTENSVITLYQVNGAYITKVKGSEYVKKESEYVKKDNE